MTRRRWIADEVFGNRAVLTGNHARHLAQVLRAQVGQEFEISTPSEVRCGRVSSVHPDRVEFELDGIIAEANGTNITIALSIFKFDRMEWAIEKCTELCVARIIPVIAGRTEKYLAVAGAKRVERWRRIAEQASEQSRRSVPPVISEPVRFVELVATPGDNRIVLDENERESLLKDALRQEIHAATMAFGPEGGWKPEEMITLRNAGWTPASLGHTILRSETAAIAAMAIANSILVGPPKN
jgi:16S rRNA (uracil1498-N3)-methyltransferase